MKDIEVVINTCFGGFCLSKEAYDFLGLEWDGYGFVYSHNDKKRTDPKVVECVKKLGEKASGRFANLKVVKIPADVKWYIDDYDGLETIHEKHRTWG